MNFLIASVAVLIASVAVRPCLLVCPVSSHRGYVAIDLAAAVAIYRCIGAHANSRCIVIVIN